MMYFIQHVTAYRNMDHKCAELQAYAANFRNIMVIDECSMDALQCEIRHKVKELNAKYPKTKELLYYASQGFIAAKVAGEADKYAFTLGYAKVNGTYRFSGNASHLKALEGNTLP